MHGAKPPPKRRKPAVRDTLASDIDLGDRRGSSHSSRDRAAHVAESGAVRDTDAGPSEISWDNPDPEFQSVATQSERSQPTHSPQDTSAWARNRKGIQRAYICRLRDAELLQKHLVTAQQELLQQAVDLLLARCPQLSWHFDIQHTHGKQPDSCH